MLADISSIDEIPQRLSKLQELRLPRASCAQLGSEIRPDQNQKEAFNTIRERCGAFYTSAQEQAHRESHSLRDPSVNANSCNTVKDIDTFNKWMWSYDIKTEAQRVMSNAQ